VLVDVRILVMGGIESALLILFIMLQTVERQL